MHIDARTLDNGSVIEGDLCIVGAGAAGISMAMDWIGASQRVLLLEAGGFEYDARMQELYRGEIVGLPYFPLQAARLHYFGGTTGHWAGFCSPFDPIDFAVRDWVPHSGWPFERAHLDPYYARAQCVLELGPYEYDVAGWQRRDPKLVPFPLDPSVVFTKMWQFSAPTRFGARYRDTIVGAKNVQLYTNAIVREIDPNEDVTAVDGLRVRTLEGRELRVRAKHYVLATCSIQNARLLLASNSRVAAGLGNAHDLVGRYFMEHLEMPSGAFIELGDRAANGAMYAFDWGVTKARGELALNEAVQRKRRVLNATVSLNPRSLDEEGMSTFQRMNPSVMDERRRTGRQGPTRSSAAGSGDTSQPHRGPREFHLQTRQEQAPNPASRVTLSAERDELGMPRAKLDWRLTELDRRSFRDFYDVLGRELGRAGVGRVQMRPWVLEKPDAAWPSSVGGGWHHMGTTRMHADPKQGVVNPDCQVHGIANLSVAGAAVFPTAGAANPTLTLVAMTLRLSDHLKSTLA